MSKIQNNGSNPLRVKSIKEFLGCIDDLPKLETKNGNKVLFRGQECEQWSVQTSAYRRLRIESKQEKVSKEYEWNYNRGLMEQFKYADFHSGYSSDMMKEDLGVLAQLQHNGAATSLIDFSDNPLVALWFACQKSSNPDIDNGKVFILYTGSKYNIKEIDIFEQTENYKGISTEELEDPNKILFYLKPAHLNRRIAAQQSYFLIGKKEILEMQEIIVEGGAKINILKELSSIYGIEETMLFPDFIGFAQANSVHSSYSDEEEQLKNRMSVRYFDKMIKGNPKDPQIYNNRGSAKLELKKYQGAIDDFNEAIKINPKDGHAYYNLGNAKCGIEDYKGAIDDFNKAININLKDGHAYYNCGSAQLKIKDYKGAINNFTEAINIYSKDANAYNYLGYAQLELKCFKAAIASFKTAIDINSNHEDAKKNLKRATTEFDDYKESYEYFTRDVNVELIEYRTNYNLK